MRACRLQLPILVALLATLPGTFAALAGLALSAPLSAALAGSAILAASFLLLWACDAAQADISQALALAVVALIAVLPEYAVDMYFTWQAGRFPEGDYASFAIANMTGANRLIIGVAWALVAAVFWVRSRRAVTLDPERMLEIRFLAAATVYALVIPLKGSLAWYDSVVFIGLYARYVRLASRRPQGEGVAHGPAAWLCALPKVWRRLSTVVLFLVAAGTIVANAQRFCEGLVATGRIFGVSEFVLVQWLAPVASEAPEFVVALMFALRAEAGLALGSLLSAKLNQWTLLVGMVPAVFALSHGSLAHPIPMSSVQMQEILLTAAQSLLAVVVLANLRLTLGHAVLLFSLFVGQLVMPTGVEAVPGGAVMGLHGYQMHPVFVFLYFAAALALALDQPSRIRALWPGARKPRRIAIKPTVALRFAVTGPLANGKAAHSMVRPPGTDVAVPPCCDV